MSKRNQIIMSVLLIAVGVTGLVGARAFAPAAVSPRATSAIAAEGNSIPVAIGQSGDVARTADETSPGLQSRIRDMVERMGITGADADKLVQQMTEHMRDVHGDQAGDIAARCGGSDGADGTGYQGMMGGSASGGGMMGGSASGGGMMGGSGSGGAGYGGMMSGSGGGYGGMMGGGI